VDDKSLYAAILGLKEPWGVEKVELRLGVRCTWVAKYAPADTLWVPSARPPRPSDHRERSGAI
jgi:hypothetical protein